MKVATLFPLSNFKIRIQARDSPKMIQGRSLSYDRSDSLFVRSRRTQKKCDDVLGSDVLGEE